jgi:DNA-directed RNA polymerase subunit RPC12/RpoP
MKCEQCGSEDLLLLSKEGALEEFKCKKCGHVFFAKAIYGPEGLFAFAAKNDVLLSVKVRGEPGKVEVLKLRSLVPELKNFSVEELERQLKSGILDFGRVGKSKIEIVQRGLMGAGVDFELSIEKVIAD